jgi:hypothetical protein
VRSVENTNILEAATEIFLDDLACPHLCVRVDEFAMRHEHSLEFVLFEATRPEAAIEKHLREDRERVHVRFKPVLRVQVSGEK